MPHDVLSHWQPKINAGQPTSGHRQLRPYTLHPTCQANFQHPFRCTHWTSLSPGQRPSPPELCSSGGNYRTGETPPPSHYRDSTLKQLGKLGAQQGNTQISSLSLNFRKALDRPAIVISHPMGTVDALCADPKLTGPSASLAVVPRVCAGP